MNGVDLRALRSRFDAHVRAIVHERDQFGYVLVLIVATLILRAWAGDTAIGLFLSVTLGGVTLAFILHTCAVHRRLLIAVEMLVVFGIVLSAIGLLAGIRTGGHQVGGAFGLAVAFVAPIVVVRRLASAPIITFRVVLGALAIYLLFGLAYSYLYALVEWLQGTPFFIQTASPTSAIYLYFSYITMATVGYGDYTPATDLGKMLAVSQALLGQLYLVSVVAIIVGNVGRVRRSSAELEAPDPAVTPAAASSAAASHGAASPAAASPAAAASDAAGRGAGGT